MKTRIISILAASIILASCDPMGIVPGNQYDKSFAFKNMENAELYLNHFYQIPRNFSQFGSCALGGNNSSMSDGLTDILKYGSIVAGTGDCNLIMTVDGQQSVSQNYFDAWTTGSGWIRRINECLAGLEEHKANFTDGQYAEIKAEALFFRAYTWFVMMRAHASAKDDLGIIIYSDLASMSPATKDKARANLDDSWDAILADIEFAAANLPEPDLAAGRVHRYAALALEARAMLYAGRYSTALAAAEKVIASNLYSYGSDYSEIFSSLDNPEVIWGLEYASGTLTHSFDLKYSQPGDVCESGNYGGGYAGPTQEFVDMFDNADGTAFNPADASRRYLTNSNIGSRDPRLAASVLYNGALWKGRALECCEGGVDQKYMPYGQVNSPGNTVTGYYMRKLLDESNHDYIINGSSQSWPEFRWAELMLIHAECLAAEGRFSEAREDVAALRRARFGRDDVHTAEAGSWDEALDLILKERCIELCYEGHRFWDLRRTGRAARVLDGKKYSGVIWSSPDGGVPTPVSCDLGARRYPERFDRFPIPQTEISNNSLAAQNSDW